MECRDPNRVPGNRTNMLHSACQPGYRFSPVSPLPDSLNTTGMWAGSTEYLMKRGAEDA